jgi:transcriptional regulator with XRE-family HTH domain
MEMSLDNNKIRTLRAARAWSQDQLAAAAGLSLRTVQRIERTGVAANESAQALAAVFGICVG